MFYLDSKRGRGRERSHEHHSKLGQELELWWQAHVRTNKDFVQQKKQDEGTSSGQEAGEEGGEAWDVPPGLGGRGVGEAPQYPW